MVETLCKVIVYYGGRGGGKTEALARLFLCIAYQFEETIIFCARQTQDEFNTTLMLTFKKIIKTDPQFQWLKDYCTFYKGRIEFDNGSIIHFVGLSEETQDKVKGIIANFFWFDEAHELKKDTYELLIPSIRERGSKVVISFNTRYDYDFVSEEFLKDPAPNVEVIQVNAEDNPYLDEELQSQLLVDKTRLPYDEFLWKWRGGFKPQSETALFVLEALRNRFYLNKDFNKNEYTRIVIGIDPATTSKDYSNQSGLCVVGLNLDNQAVLIEDCSGLLKPNELAKKTSELYHKYDCDSVVVEVNQGGDYIKNTILGYDSTLKIIEVRAKQDKINRMLPIANELYLNKIKALNEIVGGAVAVQFRKFTNNGYLGSKGESPDRAEAFAWACFELLGISEFNTIETIFKKRNLGAKVDGLLIREDVCVIYFDAKEYGALFFDVYESHINQINFKKAYKGLIENFVEQMTGIVPQKVLCNNDMFDDLLIQAGGSEFYYFDAVPNKDFDDFALKLAPLTKEMVNVFDCGMSEEGVIINNILLIDLLSFQLDDGYKSPLVKAFCAILEDFKG